MNPSLEKRFWEKASVVETENGFGITLDGRSVKTPSKTPLVVDFRAIADDIAAEWMAQGEQVDPATMPTTRMANSVIDKVTVNRDAIIDMLSDYAGSDLLCYRATTPQELIDEQARVWDPLLDWSANAMKAPFQATQGVMYVDQPAQSIEVYRAKLQSMNNYQLAGAHDLITISGSMVVAMGLMTNHLDVDQAWSAVSVDEIWQEKQWGADEEAQQAQEVKRQDFEFALNFWKKSA